MDKPEYLVMREQIAQLMRKLPGDNSVAFRDQSGGYAVNPKRFRSASLIKVFIMAEAFRQKEAGQADFSEKLELKDEYRVGGAGELSARPAGTIVPFDEVLFRMIVDSDNAATNMAIDRLGMDNINRFIQGSGVTDTVLQRKMMDFAAVARGFQNYTSATDMVEVLARIFQGTLVSAEASAGMLEILAAQNDRDGIARVMPADSFYAGKSGGLDNFDADAGIISCGGKTCFLCVICEEAADNEQGMRTLRELAGCTLSLWQKGHKA